MKTLTAKEEELMRIFWEHGAMFVIGSYEKGLNY